MATRFFFHHLGDLFPALDVPRKRDLDFEIMIKAAALDLKLQPEDGFILKVHYTSNVHLEWLIGEQKERERKISLSVRFRWYNWRSCFTFDTRSLSSASPGPVRPKSGKRLTERTQIKSASHTATI